MNIIDLSQKIENGMGVFPGDPPFNIERLISMPQNIYNVSLLTISSHTGTHMDAPLHFIDNGMSISQAPLNKLMGRAIVADCPIINGIISMADISRALKEKSDENILILRTGWESMLKNEEYFTSSPSFDSLDGDLLIECGITALAVDMPTVKIMGGAKAAHDMLLSRGIFIVEGLVNLDALGHERTVMFCASPLKIENCDGSPVRAFAVTA